MKPQILRRTLSANLALAAFLLGMPQGVLVACVGGGGCLRIEVASSEPLIPEMLPVRAGLAVSAGQCACRDACGPCREIEIGLEDMTFHLPATDCEVGSPSAHAVSFAFPANAACLAPRATVHHGARVGPAHSPLGLRSVILRV